MKNGIALVAMSPAEYVRNDLISGGMQGNIISFATLFMAFSSFLFTGIYALPNAYGMNRLFKLFIVCRQILRRFFPVIQSVDIKFFGTIAHNQNLHVISEKTLASPKSHRRGQID